MMDCGRNHSVVVDCGSTQRSEHEGSVSSDQEIGKHFNKSTTNLLIVISHPDKDHLSLLPELVKKSAKDVETITLVLGGPIEGYLFTGIGKKEEELKVSTENLRVLKSFLGIRGGILTVTSASHNLNKEDILKLVKIVEGGEDAAPSAAGAVADAGSSIAPAEATPLSKLAEVRKTIKAKIRRHMLDISMNDLTEATVEYCPAFNLSVMSANAGHGYLKKKTGTYDVMPINNDDNTNSIVIKATHRVSNQSVILTGDATGITTDQIINYYSAPSTEDLETDIMLACHHGSSTHESNNKDWIQQTKPKSTIFSCGKKADYRHPHCSVVKEYIKVSQGDVSEHVVECGEDDGFIAENVKVPVYSTNNSGTIIAAFADTEIRLQQPPVSGTTSRSRESTILTRIPAVPVVRKPVRSFSPIGTGLSTPGRVGFASAIVSRGSGSSPLTPGSFAHSLRTSSLHSVSRGSAAFPLTPGHQVSSPPS